MLVTLFCVAKITDVVYNERKKKRRGIILATFRKCVLCDLPVKNKCYLCPSCRKKRTEMNDYIVNTLHLTPYPLRIRDYQIIQHEYAGDANVFEYIKENPKIIYKTFGLGHEEKKRRGREYRSGRWDNNTLDINNIPRYVVDFFRDSDLFEFVDVKGSDKNCTVKCKCNRCGKEFWTKLDIIKQKSGHSCEATLSSGEYLVGRFLQELGIKYTTQYNTPKCINPKTNHQLPYDFACKCFNKNYKGVIIEVQGAQHTKYTQLFHSSEEAFEYQKYKDKLKKDFAINKGYKFVEIFYPNFKNDKYKNIIKSALEYPNQ